MPRIARNDLNTSFFHVMVQGINKDYIFYKKEYIEKYLQLINNCKYKYNITILAYCIMNNHAHILIYTEKVKDMAKFMHKINGIYAQYYNEKEGRVGVVFRNRYTSQPIYKEEHLIQCINYIHNNPVKAKMVQKCEEYPYSTYEDYIKNVGSAKSSILVNMFGNIDYFELFNKINEDILFDDVEIDKDEILEIAIIKFQEKEKKKLSEILQEKEEVKELIKFLKNNYKITYAKMMKRFGITKGEMNTLKK